MIKTFFGAIGAVAISWFTKPVKNDTIKANLGKDFEISYKRRRGHKKEYQADNLLISGTSHLQ